MKKLIAFCAGATDTKALSAAKAKMNFVLRMLILSSCSQFHENGERVRRFTLQMTPGYRRRYSSIPKVDRNSSAGTHARKPRAPGRHRQ
jgi:hypothetical protein